ncbi:MAG: hypothetical protein K0R26_1160 [Bacteroidota bacterium]|jgi:hypothetical protein|nr:hypothetical protein [Bacteroidota bacterium]
MRLIFLTVWIPFFLMGQSETPKFEKEKFLHFKAGVAINETNVKIFDELNSIGIDRFTPRQSVYYNPSFSIEFESYFSKYVGLSLDIGFLQLRQRYEYSKGIPSPGTYIPQSSHLPKMNEPSEGLILTNIPNVNFGPCFYITEQTRFYVGLGYYKYYYRFEPVSIGNFGFNLNNEGFAIYSSFGLCQGFVVRGTSCSISLKCFGIRKRYDRGLQLSLGLVL